MDIHCVPGWEVSCEQRHGWNITISLPGCDFDRQSESIVQLQAKLYEQHIDLSGFLTFTPNILQRTRVNTAEQNA